MGIRDVRCRRLGRRQQCKCLFESFLVVPDAGHPVAEARPSVSQGYTGQGKKTVKFYAKLPGFTEVYLYDQIPSIPLDGVKIQVEVTRREANPPRAVRARS